jgi:Zn-dependent protease/predicted transcriptional regulator
MFIKRFQIARILGFPIHIDLSWFFIVVVLAWSLAAHYFPTVLPDQTAAVYWTMGIAGTLGLFISVLLHELGHAVVARNNGMKMRGITLFIFGGVAEMSDEPPSAKVEFLVAIAGPIVSVAIAVAAYGVSVLSPWLALPEPFTVVVWYLALINFILVVFNMIPAFPLDGGRVLRSLLWQLKDDLRWATRITSSIGSAFGLLLIVFGVLVFIGGQIISGIWLFIIGLFLRNAASMSYQHLVVRRALEGERVERFMSDQPIAVPPTINLQALVDDYVYQHYHKMYPVTENGTLIGCITTTDIKQIPRDRWEQTTVADIAQPCSDENTVSLQTDAMQAMALMNRNKMSRLMVVDDAGSLVGVIALKDLLGFLAMRVEFENDAPPSPMRQ